MVFQYPLFIFLFLLFPKKLMISNEQQNMSLFERKREKGHCFGEERDAIGLRRGSLHYSILMVFDCSLD